MNLTLTIFHTLAILSAPIVVILIIALVIVAWEDANASVGLKIIGPPLLAIILLPPFYGALYLFAMGVDYLIHIWRTVVW